MLIFSLFYFLFDGRIAVFPAELQPVFGPAGFKQTQPDCSGSVIAFWTHKNLLNTKWHDHSSNAASQRTLGGRELANYFLVLKKNLQA
jgi:hypothetical protein